MAQVVWTETALNEMDAIAEYIALDNVQAAQKLVQRAFEKVDRLESFPESGKKPLELDALNNHNYRELVVNPLRIIYKIESGSVYILHVMRQERQLKNYLFNEQGRDQ